MKSWIRIAGAALVVAVAGYFVWQSQRPPSLPDGIFETNGRIEADQVQIATKFAGRIAEILAREGDMVEAGQTLARMDTEELKAQLNVAEAQARRAEKALLETEAMVAQRKGEQTYAKQEFDRTEQVHREGYATAEKLDQRRSALNTADAAFRASEAGVEEAKAAIEAANADVRRYKSQLDEAVLKAPKRGRIQYRLAEPGEVRAAGGNILTLLDLTDVYMTVFLPASAAGSTALGGEARIILDPVPQYVIPAEVTFVAAQAQFTPKAVETAEEREKLMFRVKLSIDPALLRKHEDRVKTGVRGVAYVRTTGAAEWPETLQIKLPQ